MIGAEICDYVSGLVIDFYIFIVVTNVFIALSHKHNTAFTLL